MPFAIESKIDVKLYEMYTHFSDPSPTKANLPHSIWIYVFCCTNEWSHHLNGCLFCLTFCFNARSRSLTMLLLLLIHSLFAFYLDLEFSCKPFLFWCYFMWNHFFSLLFSYLRNYCDALLHNETHILCHKSWIRDTKYKYKYWYR